VIRVLLLLCCFLPVGVQADSCPRLTDSQVSVLQRSYDLGKDADMGWTLAAIAYRESSAGRFLIDASGPSFGAHQILLRTATRRMNITDSMQKNILAQRLVEDVDLSASLALEELKFWRRLHGNNWNNLWASYNAGYNYRGTSGQKYAKMIGKHIKQLKNCKTIRSY